MRIFVTGASGWVGSAVVKDLIANGHEVLGLARSDEKDAAIRAAGAEVHRGSLEDLDSLKSGAANCDGVIHTAFSHDFSKFAENGAAERKAITALGETLEGSGRPLIVTSGTAFLAPGKLSDEDSPAHTGSAAVPRDPETAAFAFADRGVGVSVVRLPPTVHGDGDHGFIAMLTAIAREKGLSAYVGDGENRWPAVHRFDAASVFRLAVENGATGARYHATAEEDVPFRRIAEAIGRGLNIPVVSISPEAVPAHFGWFARFATIDNRASSQKTRAALGWQPTHPTLIEDLDAGYYFAR